MNTLSSNRTTSAKSRDALYTSIAAFAFGSLAAGAKLFARSVAAKDPTTQGYHLIGFGFVWIIGIVLFQIFLVLAWCKFCGVPVEEKAGHPNVRRINLGVLLCCLFFVVFEVYTFIR